MAAYRRVYDSRHLQADCKEPDQLRTPTLGNGVWATFTFYRPKSQRRWFPSGPLVWTRPLLKSIGHNPLADANKFCQGQKLINEW